MSVPSSSSLSSARRFLLAALVAIAPSAVIAHASAADASPLRAHLVAKKAAIVALSTQDVVPTTLYGKVTAESRSGVRRLRIGETGPFQWISDSDRSYAGYNLGAGSWDSLVGTLSSAVADEYLVQAALKDIPLDSLDIVFTSVPQRKTEALAYPNNLSYVAYIQSPASDAELEVLRAAVHASSSAINLVTKAQDVTHATVHYTHTPAVRDPSLPPGLRDFITEEKVPAVKARSQPRPSGAAAPAPQPLIAHTRVEPRTGLRYTRLGKDGYHTQLHDSAAGLLGYGIAPTVEEHLIGVTGTCLTHIFEVQAATRNVLLDKLELRVTAELTPRFGKGVTTPSRYRKITYNVDVESPASESEIDGLRQAVEATCPLYNLVKDEQALEGRIVRGPYVATSK